MSFCLYWVVQISSWQAYYQKLCTYYGLNRRTSTQLKLRSPKGEIDTDSVLNQLVQNLRQDIFLNKNSIQMFWYWYANFLFYYWYANFEFLDRAPSERNSYQDFHSSFKNFQLIPRTIIISATPIMGVQISYVLSKTDLNNQETTF